MSGNLVKVSVIGLKAYKDTSVIRSRGRRFAAYLQEKYGVPLITGYSKIRLNRVKTWEWMGIERCVSQYDSGYKGRLEDFWKEVPVRWDFIRFMVRIGMSGNTVYKRFGSFDFKEWEIRGLEEVAQEWKLYDKQDPAPSVQKDSQTSLN